MCDARIKQDVARFHRVHFCNDITCIFLTIYSSLCRFTYTNCKLISLNYNYSMFWRSNVNISFFLFRFCNFSFILSIFLLLLISLILRLIHILPALHFIISFPSVYRFRWNSWSYRPLYHWKYLELYGI